MKGNRLFKKKKKERESEDETYIMNESTLSQEFNFREL